MIQQVTIAQADIYPKHGTLEKFPLKTVWVEKAIKESRDILVYDIASLKDPKIPLSFTRLTPLELATDKLVSESQNSYSLEYGSYGILYYKWTPETDPAFMLNTMQYKLLWRFGGEWYNRLRPFLETKTFLDIVNKVAVERKTFPGMVFPALEDVYKGFAATDFTNARCLIIGQDPYAYPFATGVAFATNNDKETPSLKHFLLGLREMYNLPEGSFNRDLSDWTKSGVMLLNSALTLKKGDVSGHIPIWQPFMEEVCKIVAQKTYPFTVILLGAKAAHFKKFFVGKSNIAVLEAEHPARASRENRSWDHNQVFLKADEFLYELTGKNIKWLDSQRAMLPS